MPKVKKHPSKAKIYILDKYTLCVECKKAMVKKVYESTTCIPLCNKCRKKKISNGKTFNWDIESR